VPRRHGPDELRVEWQPGRLERRLVAPEAQVGRADLFTLIGVGTDERDTPSPDGEQVFDRCLRGAHVVHGHVVRRAPEHALAEHDEGKGGAEQMTIVLSESFRAEQEPVGQPQTSGARDGGDLAVAVAAGLLDQDAEVVLLRGSDDGVGELGEVVLPQFGDGESDDSGAAGAQSSCGQVGAISQFLDGGEHAQPGGLPDVGVVVDHVRHGLDRDAGHARHVVHRRAHACLLDTSSCGVQSRILGPLTCVRPSPSGHRAPLLTGARRVAIVAFIAKSTTL
jgi:hypothetical protein